MEQSGGIDQSKPLVEQFAEVLRKRFEPHDQAIYGPEHAYNKAARALLALARAHYSLHPEELNPEVAQSVEQAPVKGTAGGSNPSLRAK